MYLFVHLLIYSFIYLFIYKFICLFIPIFIHAFIYLLESHRRNITEIISHCGLFWLSIKPAYYVTRRLLWMLRTGLNMYVTTKLKHQQKKKITCKC